MTAFHGRETESGCPLIQQEGIGLISDRLSVKSSLCPPKNTRTFGLSGFGLGKFWQVSWVINLERIAKDRDTWAERCSVPADSGQMPGETRRIHQIGLEFCGHLRRETPGPRTPADVRTLYNKNDIFAACRVAMS